MVDVASVIYAPASWFAALEWQQVFARPQPVEVDLGCGKGAFLLWAARAKPEHNFIGVDRLLFRLRKVARKAESASLTNVRLVRIEASYFVSKLLPDNSVSAYHIYFPDPWPKRRHHPRRLFQEEFVRHLHRTLPGGGAVNVATDDADYFEQIQRVMIAPGLFAEEKPEELPAEAMTDFERTFRSAGKKICRGRWVSG